MKLKILSVVTLLCAGFLGVVLWRVDSFIQSDRQSWFESQSRSTTAVIEQSFLKELKTSEKTLSQFLAMSSSSNASSELDWKYASPYFAVATLKVESNKALSIEKTFIQDGSPAQKWDEQVLKSIVNDVTLSTIGNYRYYIKPFKDNSRLASMAIFYRDSKGLFIAVTQGSIFQSLVDSQRDGVTHFQIANEKSLAVVHDEPLYIGTSLKDDLVIKKSRLTEQASGSDFFGEKSNNPYYGSWQKLSQVNLQVVSKASLSEINKTRLAVLLQTGLMGFGAICLIVSGVYLILNQVEVDHQKDLIRARAAAVAGIKPSILNLDGSKNSKPESAEVGNSQGQSQVQVQKEKMQIYSRIASSLGHDLRSPLLAVLGYSQWILAKNPEGEVKEAVDSIIRESKNAKNIVEKLFAFAGETNSEKQDAKLDSGLLRAIQNMEQIFGRKGIKVTKDIQNNAFTVPVNISDLTQAFENIIQNATEALERVPHAKEIYISCSEVDGKLVVRIRDNGEGIDPLNLAKVMDPFYTSRSYHNHLGLGLTHAVGVFKEHQGEMSIQSEQGKGTVVEIVFKKAELPNVKKVQVVKAEALPEVIRLPEEELMKETEKINESFKNATPDLDMDVDQLLAMPSEVVNSHKQESPAVSALNDEKTPVIADNSEVIKHLASLPVDSMPLLDDETTPVIQIDRPDFVMPKKVSKLDQIQFDVRRPGQRERGLN